MGITARTFSDVEIFDATEKNAGDGTLIASAANFTTLTVTGTSTLTNIIAVGTPWYDVRAFGLVGDGATDNVTAWATMMTALTAQAGNPVIYFPKGEYIFNSAPAVIPNNVMLIGCSYNSAFPFGTALVANYNEVTATNGFLTWDGTGAITLGYGGGVSNMLIWKGSGKTGGSAIKRTGSSGTVRASKGTFRDVRISGDGTWNKGILIDGSASTGAGTQGIREDLFENFLVFNTTDANESVKVINGAHVEFIACTISTGSGSNPGMTITGSTGSTSTSQQIYMTNCEISGNLVLDFVNNLVASSTNVTGTVSSTVNTTGSVFMGTATTISPTNGLAIFAYDQAAAAAQNASLVRNLRATGAIMAGATYPSGLTTGQLASVTGVASGDFLAGSDNNGIFRRNANGWNMSLDSMATVIAAFNTGGLKIYNNINTIGNGLPSLYATSDQTGLTANNGPTTVYAVPVAAGGFYRINTSIFVTAVGTTSTLPDLKVTYTHGDNSTVQTVAAFAGSTGNALTTGSNASFDVYAKAGTNIQFQTGSVTAYASTGTAMQYSLHLKVEFLG